MMKQLANKLFSWFDERFELSPLIDFMAKKKVPIHHHTIWYYMGGVSLFLFIVQVISGILLLFYYRPGENSSFESIRFLLTKVEFGWLFRSLHSWSANLMVFFIFIHMFSTYMTRAYKKPREVTWLSGFVLLLLSLLFGFSGYLLPWNELAFFATKVGTDIAGVLPVVGNAMLLLLRGGEDVTGATLTRFYAIHVAMVPLLFTGVLTLHLVCVQRQGMSEPEDFEEIPDEKKRWMPFFPHFLLRDILLWLVVLGVLLYLAVFFPWDLGFKADAMAPAPAGIRPEWFFMFMFQALKMLPPHILIIEGELFGVLFFMVAGLVWMLVPFWEFKQKPDSKINLMRIIGYVAMAFIIIMTIIGYLD